MAQPVDWVGPFIEQELRAVIAWKQHIKNVPIVKRDPESRFSDDGSNFRSIIRPSDSPHEPPKVQIYEVSQTRDPVTIYITDGVTRIRAPLSEAAVSTLEAETGEKFDLEMKGDVFTIRDATVLSTPYGPRDQHVQLAIHEIGYLYHLRKPIGEPKAIEERKEVQGLIKQITSLQHEQYAATEEGHQSSPDPLSSSTAPGASREDERPYSRNENDTPRSQRSIQQFHGSPTTLTQRSPSTQFAVATQVPTKRKASGPSLSRDGFEIADGANLDRPMPPGFVTSSRRLSSSGRHQPAAADGTGAKLLSLLGKQKPEATQLSPHRPGPPHLGTPQMRSSPFGVAGPLNLAKDAASQVAPPDGSQSHSSPIAPKISQDPKKDAVSRMGVTQHHNTSSSAAQSTTKSHASVDPAPRDYSRRRIPRDQQKLLDQASSWLPSLPGRKLPHPNVPIELLTRWNTQMTAGHQDKPQTEPQTVEAERPSEEAQPREHESQMETSESPSSESSSEDEEIPASQWPPSEPPSPANRRQMLPPDSTMGSTNKPSPMTRRAERPPDSSSETTSRPSSSHQNYPAVARNGTNGSPRTPHPLPKKQDWVSPNTALHSASNLSPSQRVQNLISRSNKQPPNTSPSSQRSPRQQFDGAFKSSPHPSPLSSQRSRKDVLPVRSNPSTPKQSPSTNRQKGTQINATPASVVKATQLEKSHDDDDEMEMSVPRSLDQDPALLHRQRRSEHFRSAQRRAWIKQTYIPDPSTSSFSFSAVYNAYKSSHAKDMNVRPSEFSEAIKAFYPALYDSDGKPVSGLKLRPLVQADNVAPPTSYPRPAPADLDGAVETPGKAQHQEQLVADVSRTSNPVRKNLALNGNAEHETHTPPSIHMEQRSSKSVFAAFAAPKSSAGGDVRSTPGSGRRLPWIESSGQSNHNSHSGEQKTSRVVADKTAPVRTPSKIPSKDSALVPMSTIVLDKHGNEQDTPAVGQKHASGSEDPVLATNPQSTTPEIVEHEQLASKVNGGAETPMSVFSEFARAWKRVRPGGAFAAQDPEAKQPARRRLDVLAWDL